MEVYSCEATLKLMNKVLESRDERIMILSQRLDNLNLVLSSQQKRITELECIIDAESEEDEEELEESHSECRECNADDPFGFKQLIESLILCEKIRTSSH